MGPKCHGHSGLGYITKQANLIKSEVRLGNSAVFIYLDFVVQLSSIQKDYFSLSQLLALYSACCGYLFPARFWYSA